MRHLGLGCLAMLLACGDPGGPGATLEPTAENLSGTWRTTSLIATSLAPPERQQAIASQILDMSFSGAAREGTFAFTLAEPDTVVTGTWSSVGDTLVTTIPGISQGLSIVQLSSNVLTRQSFPGHYSHVSFDGGEPEPSRWTQRAVRVNQ